LLNSGKNLSRNECIRISKERIKPDKGEKTIDRYPRSKVPVKVLKDGKVLIGMISVKPKKNK
jgi:hypothetical protein